VDERTAGSSVADVRAGIVEQHGRPAGVDTHAARASRPLARMKRMKRM
jgi:hypothetical protein